MAELQFAKTFLAALDGRPIKLPADYVEDPRGYPARPPYILPRMPRPLRKPTEATPTTGSPAAGAVPGQERSATVSVRSLHRSPNPLDVEDVTDGRPLPLATTSLLDVRTLLAERSGVPLNKLRLLYQKKPAADSKVLQDFVGEGDAAASAKSPLKIELGVMVVGGAATVAAAAAEVAAAKAAAAAATEAKSAATTTAAAETAQTTPQPSAVESPAFWDDLRGFLVQRLADSKQADEVFSLFLRAWENRED